jgi:structure-specific recognition protein 1
MYQDFLRLRGKTYDYKILYSNIIKLFLLLKPDDVHVLFVVSCKRERQGNQAHGSCLW